jgi:hypothetical protein
LEKIGTPEEPFDGRYELCNLNVEEKLVEELKFLVIKLLNLY